MLNKLAISLFIALSITAIVQAQPIPSKSRYGIQTQPVGSVGIPASVFPGGEFGRPVGFKEPQLPEVGQTVQEVRNALSQSQQDEMRRMWADFDTAVDQNAQLQSHSPTIQGGVPENIQKLVDEGARLSRDTANRIPQHDDLRQPQALPQDKQFILPFSTRQRGFVQL